MRVTNGNFDSRNSCKRLATSRLHELHESKFPFVTLSNLSVRNRRFFLLMYPGSKPSLPAYRPGAPRRPLRPARRGAAAGRLKVVLDGRRGRGWEEQGLAAEEGVGGD